MSAGSKPHYTAPPDQQIRKQENNNYILKPRELSIVWGNDGRYWKIPKEGEDGPAELVQVSWLEVTGKVTLEPGKAYTIQFEVELMPSAFGWKDIQAFLMAKVGKKGRYKWTRVKIAQESSQGSNKFKIPDDSAALRIETPQQSNNSSESSAETNTLHFGLYEVWSGKWKGGLKIHQAIVKPV